MHHGIYAHPWDLSALETQGGFGRLAELGFRDVSLAVTDQGGRMLSCWDERRIVRDLGGGVVHYRPAGDYGRLRPTLSSEVGSVGPSPLEQLIELGGAAGVEAWAWARPLRSPILGERHPSACVVNAFGDRYRTVLCPGQAEVQDFVVQMVDDLASHDGLAGVELEAVGFADHRRGGARIVEAIQPDRYVDFLLSTCFCIDCSESMARTGLDPERLRKQVRSRVHERLATTDLLALPPVPPTPEEAFRQLEDDLGNAGMFAIYTHRLSVYMRLLTRVHEAVGGRCRIALHAHFHSLAAGDAIGAPLQVVQKHVDEIVVGHLHDTPEAIRTAWRGQPADKVAIRAAIAPKPPAYRSADDLWVVREAVRDAGGRGLKVHHLGTLPWPTLERVAAVLREGEPARATGRAPRTRA